MKLKASPFHFHPPAQQAGSDAVAAERESSFFVLILLDSPQSFVPHIGLTYNLLYPFFIFPDLRTDRTISVEF